MNDEEMYRILEDFANSNTLAKDIVVSMNGYSTSFKPRFPAESFKHEDSELLGEIVRGATHFMMWLRREGKSRLIRKGKKRISQLTRKGGYHGKSRKRTRKLRWNKA